MLLFSIRLPQTDTLVHRRKKIKRRRRKISQTWTCSAVDFFVWEFAVVAAAAPSLVFALTYCVYMYSTLVIFVVEWHSMTRHQRSSGSVWLDFPVSYPPYPSRRQTAGGLTLHKHLADDEVRVRDWVTTTLFFCRRLPSNLAVQRRRRQAVKETRKPLIYLLRHPPFYIIYVCGLYRGRRRTI
jgi:hypothetical protein